MSRTRFLLIFLLAVVAGCHAAPTRTTTTAPVRPTDDPDGVEFFGIRDHGRRIVFVIDATSTINSWGYFSSEFTKCVQKLSPTQSLNVLLLYGGDFAALSKGGLLLATAVNRRKAGLFVKGLANTGTPDSLEALHFALNQNADVIYWLDIDDFESIGLDNRTSIESIHLWNKGPQAHIHAIGYVQSREYQDFIVTLKRVAEENGGAYKTVYVDELD